MVSRTAFILLPKTELSPVIPLFGLSCPSSIHGPSSRRLLFGALLPNAENCNAQTAVVVITRPTSSTINTDRPIEETTDMNTGEDEQLQHQTVTS